jgi:hypothetical protein
LAHTAFYSHTSLQAPNLWQTRSKSSENVPIRGDWKRGKGDGGHRRRGAGPWRRRCGARAADPAARAATVWR